MRTYHEVAQKSTNKQKIMMEVSHLKVDVKEEFELVLIGSILMSSGNKHSQHDYQTSNLCKDAYMCTSVS